MPVRVCVCVRVCCVVGELGAKEEQLEKQKNINHVGSFILRHVFALVSFGMQSFLTISSYFSPNRMAAIFSLSEEDTQLYCQFPLLGSYTKKTLVPSWSRLLLTCALASDQRKREAAIRFGLWWFVAEQRFNDEFAWLWNWTRRFLWLSEPFSPQNSHFECIMSSETYGSFSFTIFKYSVSRKL